MIQTTEAVTCSECCRDMRMTPAGWQCPACDDHGNCSLIVCGHDAATGPCGLSDV